MIEVYLLTIIFLVVWTMIGYFYWHFLSWKRKVKKEAEEAEKTIERAFQKLKEKIEKEIEFLDNQPGLNPNEKELRDKLQDSLEYARELMEKEIEDIRKSIE